MRWSSRSAASSATSLARNSFKTEASKPVSASSRAQRVLPVDPAADRVGKLVLDSREAVVDGVLDGGRQANRRTAPEQADGKHQILRT
jgi:hypothetical protein